MNTPPSLFLALPLEIRYAIYSHLCRTEPISYPWGWSYISAIDIRPPPSALQLTCRFLYLETQSYYYGRATLRFIYPPKQQYVFGDRVVSSRKAIQLAKKAEIVLNWNITDEQTKNGYRSWSMHWSLPAIVRYLSENGENLGLVILSVRDASEKDVTWLFKRSMLEPLTGLPPKIRFVVGEVTAADEEEELLTQHLQHHVEELNAGNLDAPATFVKG